MVRATSGQSTDLASRWPKLCGDHCQHRDMDVLLLLVGLLGGLAIGWLLARSGPAPRSPEWGPMPRGCTLRSMPSAPRPVPVTRCRPARTSGCVRPSTRWPAMRSAATTRLSSRWPKPGSPPPSRRRRRPGSSSAGPSRASSRRCANRSIASSTSSAPSNATGPARTRRCSSRSAPCGRPPSSCAPRRPSSSRRCGPRRSRAMGASCSSNAPSRRPGSPSTSTTSPRPAPTATRAGCDLT